jgi:uncharacterized membrane protein YphA (DoxX/SURF4 family)
MDEGRRGGLQRLFSTFPGGWPGVGLLLLRAAVGLAAVVQGAVALYASGPATVRTWIAGLAAVASGFFLLIGFLTPVAGILVGLGTLGTDLLSGPSQMGVSAGWLSTAFLVVMAACVVLLGPGALSIDARLFGRREIIIPPGSRSPKP